MFAEVGSKDVEFIMAPYVWVEQIERDLDGGRLEGDRRGARVRDGRHLPRRRRAADGLIEEIAHSIDPERLIFEAPRRAQQVWLLRHFGTECNLGNIAPADVLSLETLRLGLRSDTVERFALGGED